MDAYCFPIPLSNKRNQGSLRQRLDLGLIQGKYKMTLEHLLLENNKAQKRKTVTKRKRRWKRKKC